MFGLGDRFNVGWKARYQPVSDHIDSWLPQGGDARPGRMTVFPLRDEEYVVVAPFLPNRSVMDSLRTAGRFGWILVYDAFHLSAADYLEKQLPISAVLAPDALRTAHPKLKSVGRFHNGYQLQVKTLYGSAGQGIAVVHRTSKRTTLLLSHVIKPSPPDQWQLSRRLTRDSGHCMEQIGKHLMDLGSRRPEVTVIFHGESLWHLSADEWVERCRRSISAYAH